MTDQVIVDAGPALNFFSCNKERLLLSVVGRIAVPETVEAEVTSKARTEARFRAAGSVWAKLAGTKWLEVLSDDVTPELAAAVERIAYLPMPQRLQHAKDLGETMVLAHAVVRAEAGGEVIVLMDDGPGARLAATEIQRLRRREQQGSPAGSIRLVNTPTILARAAGGAYIPDRSTMRAVYQQLRACDDGLIDIGQTDLLSSQVWGGQGHAAPST